MLLICLILLALFCFNTNVTHSSSQYCRQIMQVETVHDFVAFFAYVMFVYIHRDRKKTAPLNMSK